jgi:hypothetical protein
MPGARPPAPVRGNSLYLLTYSTFGGARVFDDGDALRLVCTRFLRTAGQEGVEIVAYGFTPDEAHLMVEGPAGASALAAAAWKSSASIYRARTSRLLWQRNVVTRMLADAAEARTAARHVFDMPHHGSFAWDRLTIILNS